MFEDDLFVKGDYKDETQTMFKTKKDPAQVQDGYFLNGRINGYGTAEFKKGDFFTGYFKDGKRNGLGQMNISQYNDIIMRDEIAKFEGVWKFNLRNGPGTMVWPDGSKFEGTWVNDVRTEGKLTMVDQNVYEG